MTRSTESVPRRKLGHSAIEVSAIGLGCMSLSGTYGRSDDAASIALVRRALDLGVSFLDSSDMYGWGHNEELLGQALQGRRGAAVLATKFGQIQNPGGANLVNGRPDHVAAACDQSLRRLRVDEIDLYYQHRVDPAVPIEETVGAMARLVERGKVQALGLSEAAPATIRRAHRVHPISAVQIEYSLLYRQPAEDVLATCRELGITLVAYSPLGRGLLSARIQSVAEIPEDDRKRQHPRFQGESFDHNRRLVARVEEIARRRQATAGQLALAWLLAQGEDVVPIPGTKRLAYLEENLGALDIRLSAEELAALDAALPPGAARGLRYPEAQMKGVYL